MIARKYISSRSERALIAQTLLLLPLMALYLKAFGLKRSYTGLLRLTAAADSAPVSSEVAISVARDLARIVTRVNRIYLPYMFSCLPESLTLWYLLRRRRVAAQLRLGVRTVTGFFESHAWVEYNHTSLNDTDNIAEIFEPFDLSTIKYKKGPS